MRDISDLEIIESVRNGNISDYSLLIDKYKNRAFSMIKKMLKNEMDAEEVLQDSFLKAYSGLQNFRNEAKFSTWFYRIVYNTTLTRISVKKRKTENEMSSIDELPDLKSDYDFGLFSSCSSPGVIYNSAYPHFRQLKILKPVDLLCRP